MKPKDSNAIKEMFDEIASNYDFLNDLLSFGLHRRWKRKLLDILVPLPAENWIDLCCGTGDVTIQIANRVKSKGSVIGIDSAVGILNIAELKSFKRQISNVQWLNRDALNTELPVEQFDGIVMSYGLRNLIDVEEGLEEVYRLLKPNGRAGFLDFISYKDNSIRSLFQRIYLRFIVVPIASIFGLRKQYSYIEDSLKLFPIPNAQKEMALKIGFRRVEFNSLLFDQMGILTVYK